MSLQRGPFIPTVLNGDIDTNIRPKKRCLFPVTGPSLENGPDPSIFVLFVLQKSPEKHCFHNFEPFFVHTGFPSVFANKIPFGKRKKKKADLPTLTFWGMLQGTNLFFFRP